MSLCHRSFQLNSPAEVSNFLKILGVSISFDLAANLNSRQMENKDNKSEEDILSFFYIVPINLKQLIKRLEGNLPLFNSPLGQREEEETRDYFQGV